MILAISEGQWIFFALAALFAFINWLSGKLNTGSKVPPPGPQESSRPTSTQTRPPPAESEEARMRRFLEALGLPADAPASPPRPVQPRPQPAPQQRPIPPILPVPPIVATPTWPRPKTYSAPPPLAPPVRAPEPVPLAAPASERIQPDFVTADAPAIKSFSFQIRDEMAEFPSEREEPARSAGLTLNETLRHALSSPQQLRSAFVLGEILGPPPGLRTS